MNYEVYGGKLRYWIFPCCLVFKSTTNVQCKETYHTVSFELLHWYVALSITTKHGKR